MTEARRPWGTGSLNRRATKRGAVWEARFYSQGQRVRRVLGPVRPVGTRRGLSRAQAEKALRQLMEAGQPALSRGERRTFAEVADAHLAHLGGVVGRKTSTIINYRSVLRVHLLPSFGHRPVDKIEPDDLERAIATMLASGASPKTTRNALVQAHGHLAFAVKRGWAAVNPAEKVDLPRVEPSVEIRFLDAAELAALYRACPDTPLGRTDRMLYRVAAMAGLRLGELIALRWRDIDFPAGTIRVRQTFVRGEWSTPKSRRGARAVPMADALAGALELHYQASRYQADDAQVLCHPDSGGVLDGSALRRRFKAALVRAGVRQVRLHDLRHSYGTSMAAAGAPMRALMEWMGHASIQTTMIYADYAPDPSGGRAWAERAFGGDSPVPSPNLRESTSTEDHPR